MNEKAGFLLDELQNQGADKAACRVSRGEKLEIYVENNKIALMRTAFDTGASVTAIRGSRRGVVAVNRLDESTLKGACASALELAQASPPDDAYDIAAREDGPVRFSAGPDKGDRTLLLERVKEMLASAKKEYPFISMYECSAEFVSGESLVSNTNGVELYTKDGRYSLSVTFLAKDGHRISSFNGAGGSWRDLSKPLLDCGGFRELLEQSIRELDASPLGNKFTGKLLITPHCLTELLGFYVSTFLSDGAIIAKTSLFLDKLNKTVAGEDFTLYSNPADPAVCGYAVTGDGYRAGKQVFVENGVLKSHALSLYGARKTGGVRAASYGDMPLIALGSVSKEAMISGMDRGLLLGRLSGGRPADNGDFSGVAKNSFLIENGKIIRPVAETMISGNLAALFRDLVSISAESVDLGFGAYPWLLTDGLVISG